MIIDNNCNNNSNNNNNNNNSNDNAHYLLILVSLARAEAMPGCPVFLLTV